MKNKLELLMVKKCIPIEVREGELYKEDDSLPF